MKGKLNCALVPWLAMLFAASASAWGPHGAITKAALDTLESGHPMRTLLAGEQDFLTNYCWIPDFYRLPFRSTADDFYTDDFLLFPGMDRHLDHICPDVEKSYEPYFRRALQAARMESPANLARWTGSLLHFVQDSGSPPHALRIRGDMHIKMENWVVESRIQIGGYVPRLLGTNDASAVRGLQQRMSALIEYSRTNSQRLRTWVLLSNRRAVEPVALAAALECARVSADVLHTLGTLGGTPQPGYELTGQITNAAPFAAARTGAKLVLHGTPFSTIADGDGRFSMRGLAPGEYTISVVQPGGATLRTNLLLPRSMTNAIFELATSGNLVRNPDFSLHWVTTNRPDFWTRKGGSWEGEVLALQIGRKYRVHADFQREPQGDVVLRWSAEQKFVIPKPRKLPRVFSRVLSIDEPGIVLTATTNLALVHLSVRGTHPTNVVKRVEVVPIRD